ncbi:MAG: hypothetical protein PUA98_00990 [Selenomonadaceae bacterium]|nr:hypothetical protein [Selenomonadaceae bacterium]
MMDTEERAKIISELFVCGLQGVKEYISVLPDEMQRIISFCNGIKVDISDCFDVYMDLFETVCVLGTDDVVGMYSSICADFSDNDDIQHNQMLMVADKLLERSRYKMALRTYEAIPADSKAVNKKFWQKAGIILYHTNRFDEAIECFRCAEKNNLTRSYLAWCRENLNDGY